MNLGLIAWKSIRQRSLASALTILSLALGIGLVVLVLSIHGVVSASFRNNSSFGYNMIVGAKGGQEQLVLNTVYYLSRPVENVSGAYYMEFLKREDRDALLGGSFALHSQELRETTAALAAATDDFSAFAAELTPVALNAGGGLMRKSHIELGRDGKYGRMCEFAIPVCLGDYLGRFRAVGTSPEFFDRLIRGSKENYRGETEYLKFEFAQGRNFERKSRENGYFEAVLGANVASELNLKVGDEISPNHGAPDGHTHERKFKVVGVLNSSGTPNDNAAFVNIEGFYLMEDHAAPVAEEAIAGTKPVEIELESDDRPASIESIADPEALPLEQREITALLVRTTSALIGPGLQRAVNGGKDAQAVFPAPVVYNLFDFFVRPVQQVLLLLTVMICFVSGVSMLVSIYNSMSERRHEIAVMRALGARRGTIFSVILMESFIISLVGGVFGWFFAHVIMGLCGPYVEQQTGVRVAWFNSEPQIMALLQLFFTELDTNNASFWMKWPAEPIFVPLLVLAASLFGLLPAFAAYRTDVANSLGK